MGFLRDEMIDAYEVNIQYRENKGYSYHKENHKDNKIIMYDYFNILQIIIIFTIKNISY